nr:MAG TPA: hypothetical protein [Caudoviricetes sp.]
MFHFHAPFFDYQEKARAKSVFESYLKQNKKQ